MADAVRFRVDPRMIPAAKVARRLGITDAVFAHHRPELERAGFPIPDPILGNYCLEVVDQWLDRRVGIGREADPSTEAAMMEAIRNRAWCRPR